MRRLTILVVTVGALGLAGCTTPPSPAPAPSTQAWQSFADEIPYERRGTFETVGREYGLSSDPSAPRSDPDTRSLIVHRASGRVVHRFQPEAGQRQAYRGLFFDRHAVILDGSYAKQGEPDLVRDQSVLWRVDLASGARERFQPKAVARLSLSDQMTEWNGKVVVPAVSKEDRSCLLAMDVASLRDEVLHCAPAGSTILRVDGTPEGVSWLEAQGADYSACKTRWWRDASGVLTQLGASSGCGIWEGLRLGDWTFAAALANPGTDEYDFSVASATNGKSTVDFGRMLTSTAIACGEHVYWIAADEQTQQTWQEVRRWKPGADRYETVLRTEGDSGRRPPACSQGVLTISNIRAAEEPYYVRTRFMEKP